MAHAAPWILVRRIDQLADRVLAIADDVRRHTLGARHDATIHDEHTMIPPIVEMLDEHLTRVLSGDFPRIHDSLRRIELARDAAAVARVDRFEDYRISDLTGSLDCSIERAHHAATRHGQSDVTEKAFRVLFVLRDLDGDRARRPRDRRLNAPEVAPEAELHERSRVEPAHGNVAPPRFFDHRRRGRTESNALVEVLQLGDDLRDIEVLAADACAQDSRSLVHAFDADFLFVVRDDHPPGPFVARLNHAPEAHVAAGERLQLECDVLEDVRQVCPFIQPVHEPARLAA